MRDPKQLRYWTIAILVAIVIGIMLLRPFFSLIIVAAITAYIFSPVYKKIKLRTKKPETAALLTMLITLLAIIIPVIIVLLAALWQATRIAHTLNNLVGQQNISQIAQETIDWINETASSISGQAVKLTYADIYTRLTGVAANIISFIIDFLRSWIGSIGSIITGVILYMYVFIGLLVHSDSLTKLLNDLSPLGDKTTKLYLDKAKAMTKAMVKGQFLIAIVQGVISTIVLYLVGVPFAMFFLLLLTFMSIIPLGAGIITIPLGVVLILLGNTVGGIIMILNHVIVVTNIDNFLKPKLVPKSVRLHPALLLLAVFGGMNMFGFLGIIIGPVLMILVITTIKIYRIQTKTSNNI